MPIENEIWKPIEGYEGLYEICNDGRIKSLYYNIILKPMPMKKMNPILRKVHLTKDGYGLIHRVDLLQKKHFPEIFGFYGVESLPDEEWRIIPGFDRYFVSNLGRVKSKHKKWNREILMKGHVGKRGYLNVALRNSANKSYLISVHRLVAISFFGKREGRRGWHVVNHKDGNKLNNRVENLEWTTNRENLRHAWANGMCVSRGSKAYAAKLTESDIPKIKSLYPRLSMKEIGDIFNVTFNTISDVIHGRTWRHV